MDRRAFVAGTLVCLTAPLAAEAQPGGKVPRVGWVWVGRSGDSSELAGFRRGLRELGYIEGQNVVVEYRFGEGVTDRLPDLIGELLRLNVDVLVTLGTLLHVRPSVRRRRSRSYPKLATRSGRVSWRASRDRAGTSP